LKRLDGGGSFIYDFFISFPEEFSQLFEAQLFCVMGWGGQLMSETNLVVFFQRWSLVVLVFPPVSGYYKKHQSTR